MVKATCPKFPAAFDKGRDKVVGFAYGVFVHLFKIRYNTGKTADTGELSREVIENVQKGIF